ncbi:tyrosine-type recombinase/integrase [Labrys sp. (in: a-proteobacteria)]|uniref:tyrosine-type recombinase/integrase n=1 Tax=Labrys sp. (in: a-proteobacteria) TaxID=1917972 RepID=UPI0039E71D1B
MATVSKTTVERLIAGGAPGLIRDDKLPGFQARLNKDGTVSYALEYRAGRGRAFPVRRVVIGKHGVDGMTPDKARRAAEDLRGQVRDVRSDMERRDPLAARKAEAKKLAFERESPTVREIGERYIAEVVKPTKKAATAALYEIYLNKHIAPRDTEGKPTKTGIGHLKAKDLTKAEVEKLHRRIGSKQTVTANRVIVMLSGVLNWAASVGAIPAGANPARAIKRFSETAKERFLSAQEIAQLGDTLRLAETDGLPWEPDPDKKVKHAPKENRRVVIDQFAIAAVRLLMLTGCRLREVLHLKWAEVDFERGMLFLADSKTGKKPVVLSAAALEILANVPKMGVYVIASTSAGQEDERPRADLHKPWHRITDHAGLEGLRIHDLRHTFAATGAGGSLGLPVIGRLLGHRNVETTQKYAHLADNPLRVAADRIADEIAAKMKGQSAEVIPMPTRGAR